MNGYETLEALRRINPRVCVLLSSGYAEPGVLAGVQARRSPPSSANPSACRICRLA